MSGRSDNRFDELRLLAAWLVLFSHSYPLYGMKVADPFARTVGVDTFGGVGVSIFFVLSGFLVMQSWERANGVLDFAWKRIRRIYPALFVCVAICVFLLGPIVTTRTLTNYFADTQTWEYFKNATAWSVRYGLPGVFENLPAPNAVNGSLWSLPYEIKCYFAVVLIALVPFSSRWKLLVIVFILSTALLVRPLSPPADAWGRAFALDYYENKLGLYFAIGALLAAWRDRWLAHAKWLWLSAIPLLLVLQMEHSSGKLLAYVIFSAMTIMAFGIAAKWLPSLPTRMGDWSYGMYLYAFPVQQLFALIAKYFPMPFGLYVLLCTIVSLALAALSWFGIERWFVKARSKRESALRSA